MAPFHAPVVRIYGVLKDMVNVGLLPVLTTEVPDLDSAKEYLSKTESGVKILFKGIEEYQTLLRDAVPLMFTCTHGISDKEFYKKYNSWYKENCNEIEKRKKSEAKYIEEIFAQSVLCGSIIQIAAMAIKKYSPQQPIPSKWNKVKNIGLAKQYFIGRTIKEIPIGLLIYASRNQHNHHDDEKLREPANTIFQRLSKIESSPNKEATYIDPAFDLQNLNVIHYASNITALMEWRSYDRYISDMEDMLVHR
ncbi:hypothetical protein N2488_01760 [SAR92 clade bacterium H231]|nr:hypothetical protein [SAR92 clade bacterium H231]